VGPAIPTYPDLRAKVAVVTGGSKGIGAALCRCLAENGAAVAVVARERTGIDRLVRELESAGVRAAGFSADCADADAMAAVVEGVTARLGPVDLLAAFAGGFERRTPLLETTPEEFRAVVDANLTSTFVTLRAFLPGMVERRAGAVVTMSSNAGRHLDTTLTAHYAAAKAGVVMLTRHAALELGADNVRVNCIAPATTLTERIQRTLDEERLRRMAELAPLKRIGTAMDSALAALFLLSDSSSWMTGVTLDVSGGRVML
jgi:3-oxoacyl-[acyl-carrier protein] reductase